MRIIVVLLSLFLVLIGLGLWVNHSLVVSADQMDKDIELIHQDIQADNWDQAYEETISFEQEWKKQAKWWPIVLDHHEMDNIEFSLAKMKEYVKAQDRVLSLGQLSELRLMILHLPEKEAVNLKNIL